MSSKYQYAKNWKFPYGNITDTDKPIDPKYLKHVQKLFKSNGGNGWWCYIGVKNDYVPKKHRKGRGKY